MLTVFSLIPACWCAAWQEVEQKLGDSDGGKPAGGQGPVQYTEKTPSPMMKSMSLFAFAVFSYMGHFFFPIALQFTFILLLHVWCSSSQSPFCLAEILNRRMGTCRNWLYDILCHPSLFFLPWYHTPSVFWHCFVCSKRATVAIVCQL